MAPSSDLLSDLNEPQRQAVRHPGGPLLVLAGAGSGKTRVLTRRVAWLLRERGVRPEAVLAFTFTNKAARELRERIAAAVGEPKGLWVGTFHSTGVRILRRWGPEIGIRRDFSIYDDDDQLSVVRALLREEGGTGGKEVTPRQVLSRISDAKEAGVGPEELARHARSPLDRRVARLYARYQEELERASALDFDDLIVCTLRLLRERPAVEAALAGRFEHVLVDEYQDTNAAQAELVNRLASRHGNLCVVGDDDQAIYGWRGADPTHILNFDAAHPGATVIRLEQNYRSTGTILDAANAVIRNNRSRRGKELWTENPRGEKLEWLLARDEEEEAELVRQRVAQAMGAGLTAGDFAVLYRTNAQSRALETSLRRAGLPYQLVGGVAFYQRREIKDLLAYLRLLLHPEDDLAFRRIANVPPRGLGDVFFETLDAEAREGLIPLLEALRRRSGRGDLATRHAGARELLGLLDALAGLREESVDVLVAGLVERTGFRSFLEKSDPDTADERLENVAELIAGATAFALRAEEPTLEAFLAEAALLADIDRMADDAERVTLMTAHAAKGLEFPVVCVVGMEEGLFPHANSALDPARLEEERRLFYVALTRAQQQVLLTGARYRRRFDLAGPTQPSRFLAELPRELLEGGQTPGAQRAAGRSWRDRDFDDFDQRDAPVPGAGGSAGGAGPARTGGAGSHGGGVPRATAEPESGSWVGRQLLHSRFGPGRVVEQEGRGSQAKLTVEFSGGVRRKILARYAEENF
ncbi:MAG: UvrD-helicase domain-containing protein [Candidatus Eisenbacteria bacterium]|nr:UvrD-helicase domain-containing protein [Candidatus Eisenbacteria bacterium]